MNVRRPPGVVVIAPRIRTGPDRHEPVTSLLVRECSPRAREVPIERRRVSVDAVRVAAGRVGLPDFDERLRNGPSVLVEHSSFDDDSLAERLAPVLTRQG